MDDFNRLLRNLRWRFGCERVLQLGIHGALGSGIALIAISGAAWLTAVHLPVLWLAATPSVLALTYAVGRWPSRRAAALAADRRLGLDERLGTAVDLTERSLRGRFDALQVQDAVARGSSAPATWLVLDARARNEALLAIGVAALGVASLVWLPALPRPVAFVSSETSDAGLVPAQLADRALPDVELTAAPAVSAQATPAARADKDLATRVQQEQAERSALDSLARALGSVSAGQPTADAIQQGNFSAARDQLQSLADNADQVSDAAKQQLARALQDAAAATSASDRQLADRERQAAQALGRSSYTEQRQALRALADQLARSGSRSVPSDQLQRDVGRLQQQSISSSPQAGPAAAGSPLGNQQANTGAGVGSGSDQNASADASRLDNAGQEVQVASRLGSGQAVRPPDGTEDPTTASPSTANRSVSELSRAQQTGQVAPETNIVPSEQRPVIRGYFK